MSKSLMESTSPLLSYNLSRQLTAPRTGVTKMVINTQVEARCALR